MDEEMNEGAEGSRTGTMPNCEPCREAIESILKIARRGKWNGEVRKVVPFLKWLLRDEGHSIEIRCGAAKALGEICDPRAVAALAEQMDSGNSKLSQAAFNALIRMRELVHEGMDYSFFCKLGWVLREKSNSFSLLTVTRLKILRWAPMPDPREKMPLPNRERKTNGDNGKVIRLKGRSQ